MDIATSDQRAWRLAPRLVLDSTPDAVRWTNPRTGTTCELDASGEYVVLRRNGERSTPVVAGQILPDEASRLLQDPEGELARRAAAHSIVAVDGD